MPFGSGVEACGVDPAPAGTQFFVQGRVHAGERSKPSVDFGTTLGRVEHVLYWSATMRLCYLALDRPDLQFPSKELARWMQRPKVGDFDGLKRAAR